MEAKIHSTAAGALLGQNPKLLIKYVAQYSALLIKEDKVTDAMALYVQYGAPAVSQVH